MRVWVPGHVGLGGKEKADGLARGNQKEGRSKAITILEENKRTEADQETIEGLCKKSLRSVANRISYMALYT